jgi:hypothetical protein
MLKIVPQTSEDAQATHKYFAKFLTLVSVLGFLSLLGVNTLLAQDAFVLSELKSESKMIADQREAISRKMEMYSSPQALANQATALGMSPSENPTFLNLTQEMPVVVDESGITRG